MWVKPAMEAVAAAHLFPANTHVLLMSKSEIQRRMRAVHDAFVAVTAERCGEDGKPLVEVINAFAVKANPLQCVLEVAQAEGFALETASIGEFYMSEAVMKGAANRIVFDSPAKTYEELHHALQTPCFLNVDNFAEIDRILELKRGECPLYPGQPIPIRATVGIRINPQTVETTKNSALATGGKISKFGVSLHDPGNLDRILDAIEAYHDEINLRMLHVHSGSQGLSLSTMVAGVKAIVQAVADHPRVASLVEVIDIGGGFPVDFSSDEETVSVHDYVAALSREVPTLFAPPRPRRVLTEFGRAVVAKAGVLISRVEYVKESGGRQIILQHIGADLAVRTVWQPEKWPLRVFLYDEQGHRKHGSTTATDVGGPCCNSGCTIVREAEMPVDVKPLRDLIVVHDVGGYYHSSFSLYNLRQMPAVYLYDDTKPPGATISLIRKPQSVEDTIALFSTMADN